MSRGARRRLKAALPTAVVETRGAGWVRLGAAVCRLVPAPARVRTRIMERVFLPRFQYRTRIGLRATQWTPVTRHYRLVKEPVR